MSLDQMIADAEKAVQDASEEDKAKAEATLGTLKKVRDAGYTKTQNDLNAAEKARKEELREFKARVEGLVGDFDQFETVVKTQIPATQSSAGQQSGEGGGADDLLTRFRGELKSRDDAIEAERNERLSFQRELKQERLSHDLERRFKDLGLQDPYRNAAREFVSPRLESIVEKAMQGEEVDEDLNAQAERIKELSPVWFEKPPDPNDFPQPRLPNGRLPDGGQPRQLTDEERLKRSESII